jgi:GNAT superfamily N-acetyltransferase
VTITVREATSDDLGSIVFLLGELHVRSTAVADADAWDAMLAQDGRTVLLAERNGDPVGTADLWIAPSLLHGAIPRAFVNYVAVLTDARRGGVGKALMEDAQRRAADAGCGDLLLMSGDHRPDAHRFYGALGYERCAVGFRKVLERRP